MDETQFLLFFWGVFVDSIVEIDRKALGGERGIGSAKDFESNSNPGRPELHHMSVR